MDTKVSIGNPVKNFGLKLRRPFFSQRTQQFCASHNAHNTSFETHSPGVPYQGPLWGLRPLEIVIGNRRCCVNVNVNVKALYVHVYKDLYKTFIKVNSKGRPLFEIRDGLLCIVCWNSYAVFNDYRQLRIPRPLTKQQMMFFF